MARREMMITMETTMMTEKDCSTRKTFENENWLFERLVGSFWSAVLTPYKVAQSVLLLKRLDFGDQIYRSGDHFTEGGRQKATSEKLELWALQ